MANNGDTLKEFQVGSESVRGLGSFHKTLPHNEYGEVCRDSFEKLVSATAGRGDGFSAVPKGTNDAAELTNPQAGLAADQLTHHPASYSMMPAPTVLSVSTAAEMTELYWMALCRDTAFNEFPTDASINAAAAEIDEKFEIAVSDSTDPGHLRPGIDMPGSSSRKAPITAANVFRLGLPDEEIGPMLSQFFVRPVAFGTQTIDQTQFPYKKDLDFLTDFPGWLHAQCSGRDKDGRAYPGSNEQGSAFFEKDKRYISTMRDLARFVNKDALHQAYFNAALILLSGKAKWTDGNPYGDCGRFNLREAGFGVLGGPHILNLVSEVATRALKIVWNQKWQVNLRLRPEAYGGLVHVQNVGVKKTRRPYGLPVWVSETEAARQVFKKYKSCLLPMAFTPGSPTHPAYGAGHATVAGACVTVLKAYFKTFTSVDGVDKPIPFSSLKERDVPYGDPPSIIAYETGFKDGEWGRFELEKKECGQLTLDGELNKLAQNVAMGRSMGGVHWRSDNSRSLILGEAIAAEILADITTDVNEKPYFEFHSFARKENGNPKKIRIEQGRIFVDGVLFDTHTSAL